MKALIARNVALLYLTFITSALVNVLPQAYFVRTVTAGKEVWLAGTLLMGTLGSMAGLEIARRFGFGRSPLAVGAGLMVGSAALLCLSFEVTSAWGYALLCVALRAAAGFGMQEIDRRSVALSGASQRRANDQLGLVMRLGGMLLGPLWFGLFPTLSGPAIGMSLILALVSLWTVAELKSAPFIDRGDAATPVAPFTPADRLVVHAARAIYASYFLLASSIIYLLVDVHHLPNPSERGAVLITIVYASAIGSTAIAAAFKQGATLNGMLLAPVCMVLAALGLTSTAASSMSISAAGATALGLAFSIFQLAFRDHATWAAVHQGRPRLLWAYNNLGSTSALLAFAVMAALVGISRVTHIAYANAATVGVAALALLAIPAVLTGANHPSLKSPPTQKAASARQ